MNDLYANVIWVPGWTFPVGWMSACFVMWLILNARTVDPSWGPADQFFGSLPSMFGGMVLGTVIFLGGLYLLQVCGLNFGFRG